MVPFFDAAAVRAAVSPARAFAAVRDGFVAYARGEWSMLPKVYVPAYPAGDFRAMPALGGGHALLKWVTSFPGNPARGLPTVTGLVLLSDAETGMLRAVLDAGAVTALRTGAAAVLAAETLGRSDARTAAVVGAGVNGRAAVESFVAQGHEPLVWDRDPARAEAAASELGGRAVAREEALAADLLVTVTPGKELVLVTGALAPGQHVSLMGADGPGKAEIALEELLRVRLFCDDWEQAGPNGTSTVQARGRLFVDDWEQASHGGEFAAAVEADSLRRDDVTQLGDVLAGVAPGRQLDGDITLFDSTGLAIQDLAIALAALEQVDSLQLPALDI